MLPWAVIEGAAPGWVFVDQEDRPTHALVGLPCGFFFGAGVAPQGEALDRVRRTVHSVLVPRSQASGTFGFLFSFSGQDWIDRLPLLLGRSPFQIFRRTFRLDQARFAQIENALPPLPEGYSLREIDAPLLEAAPGLAQDVLSTWSSLGAFLDRGYGMAVLRGQKPVSTCLAAFVTRRHMEISVVTQESERRRGLARCAAAAFMRGCLQRGKYPNWECFWDNEASCRLAQSLGYEVDKDYPIFYWEAHPEKLSVALRE